MKKIDIKNRIESLMKDLDNRIEEECETIKNAAIPKEEIEIYIRNIRWESPEMAAYVKKKMLICLNPNH